MASIVEWSPESFEDVRDWLDIVKRKIGRSVRTSGSGDATDVE